MRTQKALATLALVAALAPSTGCYFGRSSRAKSGAYLANGALVVVGGSLLASTGGNDCPPDGDISCGVSQGIVDSGVASVGALLLLGGAIGFAANLVTPTTHPAPAPMPPSTAPAPTTCTLTAPGLTPATLTL